MQFFCFKQRQSLTGDIRPADPVLKAFPRQKDGLALKGPGRSLVDQTHMAAHAGRTLPRSVHIPNAGYISLHPIKIRQPV